MHAWVGLFLFIVPGCVTPENDAPIDCRRGANPIFVTYTLFPGFAPPTMAPDSQCLDRTGRLFSFRGTYTPEGDGTGRINAASGSLHGLSGDEVREQLQRMDAFDATRDYNVTQAFHGAISATTFDHVCDAVPGFFAVKSASSDGRCDDDPALELVVNAGRVHGLMTSAIRECSNVGSAFYDLRDRFDAAHEEARVAAGA